MSPKYLVDDPKSFVKKTLNMYASGKSNISIAEKVGVSASTFSSWKNGRTVPSQEKWELCAWVLGFHPGGLYTHEALHVDDVFENPRQAAFRMDATPSEVIKLGREGVLHAFDREQKFDIREMDAVLGKSSNGYYEAAYSLDFKSDDGEADLDAAIQRLFGSIDEDVEKQGA